MQDAHRSPASASFRSLATVFFTRSLVRLSTTCFSFRDGDDVQSRLSIMQLGVVLRTRSPMSIIVQGLARRTRAPSSRVTPDSRGIKRRMPKPTSHGREYRL